MELVDEETLGVVLVVVVEVGAGVDDEGTMEGAGLGVGLVVEVDIGVDDEGAMEGMV